MSKGEEAVAMHAEGFNCAQCVLKTSGVMDSELAAKVASGFGGGLRCGEVCGAASGAVMVLGMRDCDAAAIKKFMTQFKEHYGTVRCRELKRKKIPCDDLIKYAADAVENFEVQNGNL